MKEQLPTTPYPRDEYPSYFSLFQHKQALLSRIELESPHLANAVKRLITQGVVQQIPILNSDGSMDSLVSIPIRKNSV